MVRLDNLSTLWVARTDGSLDGSPRSTKKFFDESWPANEKNPKGGFGTPPHGDVPKPLSYE